MDAGRRLPGLHPADAQPDALRRLRGRPTPPPRRRAASAHPPSGKLSGRLAVSALEGDANKNGDTMLFGADAAGSREPPHRPEQSEDQLLRLADQPRRRHAGHQRHVRHAQPQRLHQDEHLRWPPGLGHHQRRRIVAAPAHPDSGVRTGHDDGRHLPDQRPRAADRRRRAGLPPEQVGRQGEDLRGRHAHLHDRAGEHRDRRRDQRRLHRSAARRGPRSSPGPSRSTASSSPAPTRAPA